MKAIIKLDVPEWQVGQEVTVYFKDTMMKRGICELENIETEKPCKININDEIKVKLTGYGKKKHCEHYIEYTPDIFSTDKIIPKVDKEGYTKYQLWEFMNIFGIHLYNGAKQVIENNEIIL